MKSKHSSALLELDNALSNCVQDIDILKMVSPLNYLEQKEAFFNNHFKHDPKFIYSENKFNLFEKKRELFNLPIENVKDNDLYTLYAEVIQSYVDKVDQYRHLGSNKFLYDSMRYYGEPSDTDLNNAEFLVHLTEQVSSEKEELLDASTIVRHFESFADAHNYALNIKLVDNMVANALVVSDQVIINSKAKITKKQMKALAHHELGVHLATTLNGRLQPLKILSLGSPVNTTSQEGLAMLCEYYSGFMEVDRLRQLALRVIAVKSQIEDRSFSKTFALLMDKYGLDKDKSFALTTRVHRGGGFTKDHLYLKGFRKILTAHENEKNFNNLMSGKVSLEQLPLISRLINKGYLNSPKYISPAIKRPVRVDPILQFVAQAIKE